MSSAGGPKDRRREFEKKLLDQLWRGEVEGAIELQRGVGVAEEPGVGGGVDRLPEKRRASILDYEQRQRAAMIASTRVEKFNDWAVSGRCSTWMSRRRPECWPWPHWKLRDATVNSTSGVEFVRCRNDRYQNRFARPLDRQTAATSRQEILASSAGIRASQLCVIRAGFGGRRLHPDWPCIGHRGVSFHDLDQVAHTPVLVVGRVGLGRVEDHVAGHLLGFLDTRPFVSRPVTTSHCSAKNRWRVANGEHATSIAPPAALARLFAGPSTLDHTPPLVDLLPGALIISQPGWDTVRCGRSSRM